MDERLRGLTLIFSKTLPDLKVSELTGKDGESLFPRDEQETPPARQVARAVLAILHKAQVDVDDGDDEDGDA